MLFHLIMLDLRPYIIVEDKDFRVLMNYLKIHDSIQEIEKLIDDVHTFKMYALYNKSLMRFVIVVLYVTHGVLTLTV
jgi:hypothetical protein